MTFNNNIRKLVSHYNVLATVEDTLWNIGGGGGVGLALKFEYRKWHLQHSENTFCKKLGFQNTVLMVRFLYYESHAKYI